MNQWEIAARYLNAHPLTSELYNSLTLKKLDMIFLNFYFVFFSSNDEKIDQIGYRQTTNHSNPIAYNSDLSLNKSNRTIRSSHSNHNIVGNGYGFVPNLSTGNAPHSNSNTGLFPGGLVGGVVVHSENKSDDGNPSIPHIADFYPEDNSTVPADNPRTSTLFLPKASKLTIF